MTTAQLADGTQLEFPDGTSQEVISRVVKQHIAGSATHQKESGALDTVKNLIGGQMKAASNISSNLMYPVNWALNKAGIMENTPAQQKQAVADTTQIGDKDSTAYKGSKFVGDIAATMPIGGLLGKGAGAVYGPLGEAISSGGFSLGANSPSSKAAQLGLRLLGGAINGGSAAGLIDPQSAGTGAVIGAAVPMAAKTVGYVGGTIGDALKPFTAKGKEEILAKYLQDMAGSDLPQTIKQLENAQGLTAGFNPTTGQAANNANLATLERTMKARNPSLFNNVDQTQRTALADAIKNIGGDDLARQGLVDSRETAVKSLYDTAKQAEIPLDEQALSLMQRPALKQAINEAKQNAMNRGGNLPINLPEPTGTIGANGLPAMTNPTLGGNSAHEIKMALDAARNQTAVGGANKAQLSAIGDASNEFNQFLENAIPAYGQAKSTFSEMSKPINQMDLGNAIRDKFIPASLRDMPNPLQLNREQLAKVLHDNGDKLAQSVTGFKGSTLKNTLSPEQLTTLENAVKDSQYIKQGELLGKGGGSDTFQKLAFNGDMEKAGLVGKLLNTPAIGATANAVKGVANMAYSGANKQLEQKLAEALLNPQEARTLLMLSPVSRAKALANLLENRAAGTVGAVSSAQ